MSKVKIVFYCGKNGKASFLEWFDRLPKKAQDKCMVRIERLSELGYRLRRPEADYLRDDIFELRFRHLSVNYRVLYFFHGRKLVVLSHGISKQQSALPTREIEIAVERMNKFNGSPSKHTFEE